MKIISKIFTVVMMVVSGACADQGLIVKCPDCTPDEPTSANLEVKMDIAFYGKPVLINIYEGNLEDSVLYSTHQGSGESMFVPVTLNKKFTLTATYNIGDKTYIAVDAVTPRVKYDKEQCDDPCYFVYDKKVDLRLKYTK